MLIYRHRSHVAKLALIGTSALLAGCSCSTMKKDPYEKWNRGVYAVNKVVDDIAVKPAGLTYKRVVPPPMRGSVDNFFRNMGEIPTVANGALQAKPKQAGNDAARLIINTTLGLGGLFDVATEMGLERHQEDFGQTLIKYGYADSAYVVIPLLGPSTIRDSIGLTADYYISPPSRFKARHRNAYYGTMLVHTRAKLLGAQKLIDSAGVDEYVLVRESYLQNRRFKAIGEDATTDPNSQENELLGEPPE